jgi:hypothetical protein
MLRASNRCAESPSKRRTTMSITPDELVRLTLSYRCFTARGRERVPLLGEFGLVSQLGSVQYARPRKFREKIDRMAEADQGDVAGMPGVNSPAGILIVAKQRG